MKALPDEVTLKGVGGASSPLRTSVRMREGANALASVSFRCLTGVPGSHLRSTAACSRSGLFKESQEPVVPCSTSHLLLHRLTSTSPTRGHTAGIHLSPALCSPSSPLGTTVESRGHQRVFVREAPSFGTREGLIPALQQLTGHITWCFTTLGCVRLGCVRRLGEPEPKAQQTPGRRVEIPASETSHCFFFLSFLFKILS